MRRTTTTSHTGVRLLVAAGLTTAGSGLLLAGGHYLLALLPARGIDALVTVAVLGAGLAVLTWYVLSAAVALLCLTIRATGLVWASGEALVRRGGAPAVRRLMGSGAGALLVAGSLLGPAHAATDQTEHPPGPVSLTWAPPTDTDEAEEPGEGASEADDAPTEAEPDDDAPATEAPATEQPARDEPTAERPTEDGADEEWADEDGADDDASTQGAAGAQSDPAPPADPDPGRTDAAPGAGHTVRAGDTLWSVAAAALGEQATDTEIAAHWPQWYRANNEVIGPDPDLIIPGQVLTQPERSTP